VRADSTTNTAGDRFVVYLQDEVDEVLGREELRLPW